MILVGFVARTHGNRGEVILKSESDFAEERFSVGATLFAGRDRAEEVLTVTAVRFQQGRPIIGVAGIGSISEAERLAGLALKVPASTQAALPPGQYYHHELVGCDVVTRDGDVVGRVSAVQGTGGSTRLVVAGRRGEVLIPLAQEICDVNIAAKRIVVTPPDGLLEVNGDWR